MSSHMNYFRVWSVDDWNYTTAKPNWKTIPVGRLVDGIFLSGEGREVSNTH